MYIYIYIYMLQHAGAPCTRLTASSKSTRACQFEEDATLHGSFDWARHESLKTTEQQVPVTQHQHAKFAHPSQSWEMLAQRRLWAQGVPLTCKVRKSPQRRPPRNASLGCLGLGCLRSQSWNCRYAGSWTLGVSFLRTNATY